ncbi:MAG TPA: hypothetical protein VKS44_12775 [Candidatus Acidoferrales bacterium]|nr:hypothetical protein [Candidatus Acidoferrales bacterium]
MAQTGKDRHKSIEKALEDAVSRALRDNLAPLQRTAEDLQQAYADLVAACSSTRPANALPAMLRAQTSAAALAAGLSVLSNFVTLALNPRDHQAAAEQSEAEEAAAGTATSVEENLASPAATAHPEPESQRMEEPESTPVATRERVAHHPVSVAPDAAVEAPSEEAVAIQETGAFDLASLPPEVQDLHRRANRVAKVAMQDIKLLRPKDVRLGSEHKDICHRLRNDIDKARKEYDRRFRTILDDPVDYFHHWMVQILAEGDPAALGEYPYPSSAARPVGR